MKSADVSKKLKSRLPPSIQKAKPLPATFLPKIYRTLRRAFGTHGWWPGETPFEIIVGAILTQNTAWKNVEMALHNLKSENLLTPQALYEIEKERLAQVIRPSGCFNLKAERLKKFIEFLYTNYQGSLDSLFREDGPVLRLKLLNIKGIGPETADSILLYAAGKAFFVIDAYTKRIFTRHKIFFKKRGRSISLELAAGYQEWQDIFTGHLPLDKKLFNDFHAQIVHLAKRHCHSRQPDCEFCPLRTYL